MSVKIPSLQAEPFKRCPAPSPAALAAEEKARAENARELDEQKVPPALRDRMLAVGITSEMLRHGVFQRGCYPEDTPIAAYDPEFLQRSLLPKWDKWREYILDNADIPF